MEFTFHFHNSLAETGLMMALSRCLGKLDAPPVVLCIGSDLAVGDAMGPITGTMLRRKASCCYIYGSLKNPVTAKEVKYVNEFLRRCHPRSKIIAVDAAVGEGSDIGLLKVVQGPLRPGSGTNKRLGSVGDVSILGIVAEKSAFSYSLLNLTRLYLVYYMAEIAAGAIASLTVKDELQFA